MPVSARRDAVIGITVDPNKMDSGIDGARRKMSGLRKEVEDGERAAAREAAKAGRQKKRDREADDRREGQFVKGMVRQAGARVMDLGIDTFKSAVDEAQQLDKAMTEIRVSGEMSAADLVKFRDELLRVSDAVGVNAVDLADGAQNLIGFTGHADRAKDSLELLARTMKATGSSKEDVAGLLAAFDTNFHFDAKQSAEMMDVIAKQAHLGGVEMKGFAGAMTPVLAKYAAMTTGGSSVKGLTHIAAIGETLTYMTHDAMKSADALFEINQAMTKGHNVKEFRAIGLEPYGKDGKVKDMLQFLHELKSKNLKGEQLANLFPEGRAREAVGYLQEQLDVVDKIVAESANSNQIQIDGLVRSEGAAAKYETAMVRLKNQINITFSPEVLAEFADAAAAAMDRIGKSMDWWRTGSKGFRSDDEQVNERLVQMKDVSPEQNEARAALLERQAKGTKFTSEMAHHMDEDSWFGKIMQFSPAGQLPKVAHYYTNDRLLQEAAGQRQQAAYKRANPASDAGPGGALGGGLAAGATLAKQIGDAVAAALSKSPVVVKPDSNAMAAATKQRPQ
jgi:hypothetical protein